MRYLLISLIALLFVSPAYADDDDNVTNTAAAVATGGVAGAVVSHKSNNLTTGSPGGLSNGWTCAVSYSFSTVFFGWSWTDDSELCRLAFQKNEVCSDSPGSPRCAELKAEFANWKPQSSFEPDAAAAE